MHFKTSFSFQRLSRLNLVCPFEPVPDAFFSNFIFPPREERTSGQVTIRRRAWTLPNLRGSLSRERTLFRTIMRCAGLWKSTMSSYNDMIVMRFGSLPSSCSDTLRTSMIVGKRIDIGELFC